MPTTRRRLTRIALPLGLLGLAATTASVLSVTPATAAVATSTSVDGSVVAISTPTANGTMWVLTAASGAKTMDQINVNHGEVLGSESVSPYASNVALSPNGATVALGTTEGGFPAAIWYSALTGRFANASKSPAPVLRVAVNATGNIVYALRATSPQSVFALATSNGLGFTWSIPGAAVDLAPNNSAHLLYVLQADGTVGSVSLPGGTYNAGFPTGAPAKAMALSSDGTTLFVLRTGGGIADVDVASGKVVETIPSPSKCVDIALSTDGHTLYEALRGRTESTIKSVLVPAPPS